jgi:hypothetical protein
MGWLASILGKGDIVGDVTGFLAKRQELRNTLELAKLQGAIDVEKAKAAYKAADLQYDNDWELEQIKNSGWKDEYVLMLLSIPLALCFVPFTAPWVLAGFGILAQCPDWYRWLILVIFGAVYGIRIYRRQSSGDVAPAPKP